MYLTRVCCLPSAERANEIVAERLLEAQGLPLGQHAGVGVEADDDSSEGSDIEFL